MANNRVIVGSNPTWRTIFFIERRVKMKLHKIKGEFEAFKKAVE